MTVCSYHRTIGDLPLIIPWRRGETAGDKRQNTENKHHQQGSKETTQVGRQAKTSLALEMSFLWTSSGLQSNEVWGQCSAVLKMCALLADLGV